MTNHNKPKANAVGWFEIYVDDIERARKFYETVFQVAFTEMSDPTDSSMKMLSFPTPNDQMSAYGAPGALVKMNGYGPSSSGTIIYFSSPDCADEESRVESAGGSVIKPKEDLGEYGFITLISDSEGNTIGIHSMK